VAEFVGGADKDVMPTLKQFQDAISYVYTRARKRHNSANLKKVQIYGAKYGTKTQRA